MAYIDGSTFSVGIVIGTDPEVALPVTKFSVKPVSAVRRVHTAGKRTPAAIFPAEVKFSGTIEFPVTEDVLDIMDLVNSVDGATLTTFTVNDGVKKYTGCKCAGVKVGVKLNEEAVVSFDFAATAVTTGAAVTPPTPDNFYVGHNITLTGVAAMDAESVDVTVTNSLKEIFGMKGAGRTPVHLAEGYQTISADIKYLEDPAVDVSAASPSLIASATVVLSGNDSGTFTITLTNLHAADSNKDAEPEDIVRFGLKYEGSTIAFSTT